MSDLPLTALRDLELRYDGPIPAQYRATEQTARRRARGTIAVLENQGAEALNAAIRCEEESEELAADLGEPSLSRWQRDAHERRRTAAEARAAAHIESAVRAFREAAHLRGHLVLPPHPLVRIACLLPKEAAGPPSDLARNGCAENI